MAGAVLGTLAVKLRADTAEFAKGMKGAQTKLQGVADTAKKVATVAGVAFGGMALLGSKFVSVASDMDENMNVVSTSFGKMTPEILKWARTAASEMGRSEFQMREFAGTTQAMLAPMTGSKEAAAKMSTQIAQLAVDIGSFNNVADTDALIAIKAGLIGSIEPMMKFGVVMNVAALEAFALAQGIDKSVKDMSSAEKVALRYAFIMANTTLQQGDAAKTAQSFANVMKSIEGLMTDIAGEIGAAMLPMVTSLAAGVRDLLGWFKGLSPEVKEFAGKALLAATALAGIVAAVAGAIAVAPILVGALGTFVAALKGVAAIAAALAPIVAGIALGLGVMGKEGESTADTLKRAFSAAGKAVSDVWTNKISPFIDGLTMGFAPAVEAIGDAWDSIKTSILFAIGEIAGSMGMATDGIAVDWRLVGGVIGTIVGSTIEIIATLVSWIVRIGALAGSTIIPFGRVIAGWITEPISLAIQFADNLFDAFADIFSGGILQGLRKLGLAIFDFVLSPMRLILRQAIKIADAFGGGGLIPDAVRTFSQGGLSELVLPGAEEGPAPKRKRMAIGAGAGAGGGFNLAGMEFDLGLDDVGGDAVDDITDAGEELASSLASAADLFETQLDITDIEIEIDPVLQTIGESLADAGQTLANAFLSEAGSLGDVVEGARAGMEAGGPWGAVIGAIVALIQKTEAFAMIIGFANQIVDIAVGQLNQLLMPIARLIQTVVTLLMTLNLLASVTHGFGTVVEVLGYALEGVSWIVEKVTCAITSVWNWIVDTLASWVRMIPRLGDDLAKSIKSARIDIQHATRPGDGGGLMNAIVGNFESLGDSMSGLGDTVDSLNESLTNVPSGFKVAAARYRSIDASDEVASPGSGISASGITVNIAVDDVEAAAERIIEALEDRGYAASGSRVGGNAFAVDTGGA